jgi:hypothetical protein
MVRPLISLLGQLSSGSWLVLGSAGLPNEKKESRDQASREEHPILAVETQDGEMPNQKLHRCRHLPFWAQDKRCSGKNILYLYSGSAERSGISVHRQSIQEIFQRSLSCQLGRAVRSEAAFPQPDAHGPSFAA